MFGKGSVTSNEMNQHKTMAGAGSSGDFGVKSGFGGKTTQPGVKSFDAMNDGSRGAPPGMARSGGHAMQSAPDHGPAGADHFSRGPKY
jgi:hypothetical protein